MLLIKIKEDIFMTTDRNFESLDELEEFVSTNENVITLAMVKIRDAYGASKLGVNVRENIKNELTKRGLGHYPSELPVYQYEKVRLYKKGSSVGLLIDAVLEPMEQNDVLIRSRTNESDSETLRKIRELVEES